MSYSLENKARYLNQILAEKQGYIRIAYINLEDKNIEKISDQQIQAIFSQVDCVSLLQPNGISSEDSSQYERVRKRLEQNEILVAEEQNFFKVLFQKKSSVPSAIAAHVDHLQKKYSVLYHPIYISPNLSHLKKNKKKLYQYHIQPVYVTSKKTSENYAEEITNYLTSMIPTKQQLKIVFKNLKEQQKRLSDKNEDDPRIFAIKAARIAIKAEENLTYAALYAILEELAKEMKHTTCLPLCSAETSNNLLCFFGIYSTSRKAIHHTKKMLEDNVHLARKGQLKG